MCDIGGGTIDLIGLGRAVTAAGAGEAITTAVARVLGIPRALAERVKRTPALRVEGPHVAHEEDGRRLFLDSPAAADAIGRLCTRGSAGLVPFSNKLAAEEWRSLRLAIKQETVAANIVRCLRAFDRAAVRAGAGRGRSARRRTAAHRRRGPAFDVRRRRARQHRRRARSAVRGGVRTGSPLRRRQRDLTPLDGESDDATRRDSVAQFTLGLKLGRRRLAKPGNDVAEAEGHRLLELGVGARTGSRSGRQRLNWAVWRKRSPSMWS